MKASGIALVASLSLLGLCPCASIRMMPKSDVEDFEDEHSDFGPFDDEDGFGDDERSFYGVYGGAFASVDAAEAGEATTDGAPFGDATSDWDDVKRFYDRFTDFQSARAFAAYDKYRVSSEEARHIRRAAEAENKRERKAAKGKGRRSNKAKKPKGE